MQNKLKKIPLVVSIIIFLFFCILFVFIYKEIKKNIKISEQSQINLETEIKRREDIKKFNDSFKSIEQNKALFETHFAQNSDIVPFLNTIEKIAGSVGVKTEVSFIEVTKDNTGLMVEMKNKGSFEQIYKFLMLLENSPYELEFTSIEMNNFSIEDSTKNAKNTIQRGWEATFKIKLISFI